MEVDIIRSRMSFKSPEIGRPARMKEEHYNGRRITAVIDGEEEIFRFKKDEMDFNINEDGMKEAIKKRLENDGD